MYSWYDAACEILLCWILGTISICIITLLVGFIIDQLRERKELRKMLCEKYIQYRIFRWNHKGY